MNRIDDALKTLERDKVAKQNQATAQLGEACPPFPHPVDQCNTVKFGLRDRVHSQRVRAESETHRAMQLAELEYLLDKNPDIARILDLMDVVKS